MKKNTKQTRQPATGAAAPGHWLDAFGVVRSARTPHNYVDLILKGVMKNICLLRADGSKDGCTADEVQNTAHELFDPIQRLIDQGKATGDSLEREADQEIGARVADLDTRAQVVYAYCHEAESAFNMGEATAAWTLIVDAMRVAADIKAPIVHVAGGVFLTSSHGKKASVASHATSGHATPETKEKVHRLYLEWRAGEYVEWTTQSEFAVGCQKHLNGAKVSVDTIEKKWIPKWNREAQE